MVVLTFETDSMEYHMQYIQGTSVLAAYQNADLIQVVQKASQYLRHERLLTTGKTCAPRASRL